MHPSSALGRVGTGRIALRIGRRFGQVGRQPYEGGRVGKIAARCWRFCELSQSCAWAAHDGPTCGGPVIVSVTRRGAGGRRKWEEGRPAVSLTETCCCNVGVDATGVKDIVLPPIHRLEENLQENRLRNGGKNPCRSRRAASHVAGRRVT